tara:strand:- start:33 stop:305 length:273 start_codon:yes stop_codon:yes gene_type:complete
MNDDTLFADGFDDAIIGLSSEWENVPRVVYSKHKMVLIIMKEGLSYEEAVEHLEYNVWGRYVGEGTPIYSEDRFGETRDAIEELLYSYEN